ncbi:HopJ type III effector protein [Chryseobacterium ureilyticum]|uniref:HopJ type III effector protein n=1 Tax=Chryseobacterium ureilyticum TaxID=373668 RepID=A0A1N7PG17_9FLAO|nr:HopJ type III effector protein [Chryseobacterium ureilyticum]SIT09544.1 HopJ type III effector protein [Chryseobacterium ureilyticum]
MLLLEQLQHFPETIQFSEVITYIDAHYDFTPTAFKNGNTRNEEGQNNGSCKIFGFASYNGLTKGQTLSLFGEFYRDDVLKNPQGTDHQNIRNFMEFGWEGLIFEGNPLKEK